MHDYASMLMQEEGHDIDGLGRDFWLAPQLPHALRQRVETVFEVLSHLPLEQPLAVVTDAGKTVAVNAPLSRLLGGSGAEMIGQMWSRVMPGWPDRSRSFRREGEQVFEEHLIGADGDPVWVRVSLGPLAESGETRAMAYALFISRPDVETIDHDEVRRLRKSLDLFAEMQADYVVEIDRNGTMTFVSPSFCRALGALDRDLVGREFLGRVLEEDRDAVSATLEEAAKPPFSAEMTARLAAEPGRRVEWQVEAVIGDGIVGLDLVGRPADRTAVPSAASTAAATSPAAAATPRVAAIAERIEGLRPGDGDDLVALARAVGSAAGAECAVFTVRRGDAQERVVGWRLPVGFGV